MKYIILGIYVLLSKFTHAQCCENFELAHDFQIQEIPSLDDLESCSKNDSCDIRYYYAGKMIHAMRDSDFPSINQILSDIITNIENSSTVDNIDESLIYSYAIFLEIIGKESLSSSYYEFIKNKTGNNSIIKKLSIISIYGIDNRTDEILNLIESLDLLSTSNFHADESMLLIRKASQYLTNKPTYDLFKKYKNLYKTSNNDAAKYVYLTYILYYFSEAQDTESYEIRKELEKLDFAPPPSYSTYRIDIANSKELLSRDKYDEGLLEIRESVKKIRGDFTDNRDLLQDREKLSKVPLSLLSNYAQSNLFQTRMGKGLPPVIDAFKIYEAVYQRRLEKRMKSISSITTERDLFASTTPNNILIVGIYLYQNTQDIKYLNRTYSIINGMAGGGISYWSKARSLMRRDNSFRKIILEEQRLVADVMRTDKDDSLREIFNRQSALETYRMEIENEYEELYDAISESYTVDLEVLQNQMKRDTAACLNFFLDNQILYRLYVSPDTIDIFPVDDIARVKSVKLTEQLAQMVESGKSAKAMESASRELYGYLFEGIEDVLPPRLHIIANSKLLDVPFSVLRKDTVGESPRYLGVEHAISRQFSLGTMRLLEETELAPTYAKPLAMAPSFANELLQAGELRQAGFQLPPLIYNTEELRDLQTRGNGKYLYDDEATIGRYRDQAAEYGIIHLATHAISSEVDGLRSRVYLLDDEGEPVGLYAGDIGKQTLNSELVVLSACETGGGGTDYVEGRVGLTKAYLAAGARSVVASNWAVDDHATAEQMKTFYDGIEAGQPPHVALQGARRAYLEAHPDAAPYKWAAFEAYGGMRPVRWDKESGTGKWWWLALPLLGVGATVVWNKKRSANRAA